MIIYDFYSNRTAGPIVDYLCTLIPHTRLVDYQLIDSSITNTVSSLNVNQKLFTFGCEGETFHIIIDVDDDVRVGIGPRLLGRAEQHLVNKSFKDSLVSHLIKVARDYKIKQVID